jgi:hypothetical protein
MSLQELRSSQPNRWHSRRAIDRSRTDTEITMMKMNGSIVRWCAPVTERAATTKQRFALIAFRLAIFHGHLHNQTITLV